ncbi:adenylate/guanylate cyclase domain-containing protein [Shimia sp. MIT910701]|uniref:adenylate/guanylate cyclase domain-containing protein n=1 Tax=Shimia sp. MIT910701 TaxID=3096987 RepID=UPI00399AC4C9
MPWSPQTLTDWLLTNAAAAKTLDDLTQQLGAQLAQANAPVWRLRFAMRTLHPLLAAVGTTWENDTGPKPVVESTHGLETRGGYAGSPMTTVSQSRKPFRQNLSALAPDHHEVLHELRAQGGSDYYALPVLFGDRVTAVMTLTTRHAGGFTPPDLAGFDTIAAQLAPFIEVLRLTTLSSAVSEAYLGKHTAQRVWAGEITRGHVDIIDAAILISDLRGWTQLNVERDPEQAVAIANTFFEVMDATVTSESGEILKFMGDAVLAIFPASAGQQDAVARALRAAQAASSHQTDTLRFGIGLNVGEVLYGNVGSEKRLDFTVMGPAVNLAARIESLCAQTECPILMSHAAANLVPRTRQVGTFSLKGLPSGEAVYAPSPMPE